MGATYNFFLYAFVYFAGFIWATNRLIHSNIKLFDVANIRQKIKARFSNSIFVSFCISYFPLFFALVLIKSFAFDSFSIPSESMSPTLQVGDFIITNRYQYGVKIPFTTYKLYKGSSPERGDIIVFNPPHIPNKYLVKRIIGVPGDVIHLKDYLVSINGEPVEIVPAIIQSSIDNPLFYVGEKIGAHTFTTIRSHESSLISSHGDWIVPEGKYFVMGDNRDNSSDSREWGFVDEALIYGKAERIWMHMPNRLSVPRLYRNHKIQ